MQKPDIRLLKVADLIVDLNVQRSLDQHKVAKIAEELDLNAIGVITVSRRANGTYHIVDGQHRVAALRLAGGEDEKITARVFAGLTIEEEARLFRLLNNTSQPQLLDKFRVRIVEGETVAVAINDILTKHGLRVTFGSSDGCFSAVAAAERVYRLDPSALDRALATLTRAWGVAAASVDGRLVEGVGRVYARHGDAVNVASLTDRLARHKGGSGALIGKARGLAEFLNVAIPNAMAEIVVELYNTSRKTTALPAWRQ